MILLAIAVVIVGLCYFVTLPLLIPGYADDLIDIKAQVKAEKATLAAMQSETLGISLQKYGDGTRGIILPKGFRYKYNGEMEDEKGKKTGRIGIAIEPY